MIAPTTKQPAQIPIALARCLGLGKRFMISDRVDGDTAAPAMPSTARATISISGLVAWAAITEATPNRTAPLSNSLRRPIRSPIVPIVIMKPATMNPYTSMIHSCWLLPAPNCVLSCGKASNMTKMSRDTSRVGRASTASPAHSRHVARASSVALGLDIFRLLLRMSELGRAAGCAGASRMARRLARPG